MLVERHLINAQRALDLGMDGELVIVDHREHGVEVHERARLGNVEGEHLLKVGVLHDVLGKHEHIAALDRVAVGQVVPHLVVLRGKVAVVEEHVL